MEARPIGAQVDKRVAPEADVHEQTEPAGDESTERLADVPEIADRPEADVLEQAQVVEEDQIVDQSTPHEDKNEADWFEQSVSEPLEEEGR